jgi:hypothetical protein
MGHVQLCKQRRSMGGECLYRRASDVCRWYVCLVAGFTWGVLIELFFCAAVEGQYVDVMEPVQAISVCHPFNPIFGVHSSFCPDFVWRSSASDGEA